MTETIRPCLTFKDRAEEAVKFYVSVFPNSKVVEMSRVETDGGPIPKGKLLSAIFELDGRQFRAFDGGETFTFSEGFSLDVTCKTQAEVDRYWSKLTSGGGEEGPCGWLKDRFGVSWQVVPEQLGLMLSDPHSGNAEACMHAMMKMKKIDIATLERAYRGSPVA
jgi:predicted 3-demethylubiquinone-9 3-methyltransferase (glyoxalase superfamily)